MAATSYKLDLEQPKRNVFVTQLNQREDEEDEYQAYPIVKESAGKLLETGLNTLQKTLLLKKEVEVDHVNDELAAKREEFRQRMEQCTDNQIMLQKKQHEMKDRVTKFEKFIQENEAKRRRAIQKYQQEVRLREQKSQEYELLLQQLQDLKIRQEYLREKLAKFKKFEDYLLSVVDILPKHYLEVQDSLLNSLMMRHRTLSATNQSLLENLQTMSDNHEAKKMELEMLKQDHDKMKLSINSRLALMQKSQESNSEANQEKEQKNIGDKIKYRRQRTEYGCIMMAIENISEKCRRRMDPNLCDMTTDEKLDMVKVYINDRADVARMAGSGGILSPAGSDRKARLKPAKKATFQ